MPVTARVSKCFEEGRGCDRSSLCSAPSCRVGTAGRHPEFRAELQQVRSELVFTMFVYWVLNLVSTAGLVIALGWH